MVEIEYYENGNLEYETPFENGKRHGVEKEYDENGNIIKEILYENGELKTGEKNAGRITTLYTFACV